MSLTPLLAAAGAMLALAQADAHPGSKDWSDVATIGGGVAAQLGCTGVFVSGRPASTVERDDVHAMNPLLGAARITVDTRRRTVRPKSPGWSGGCSPSSRAAEATPPRSEPTSAFGATL